MELKADNGAEYDEFDEINLSELEPLIALPSSPGKVVPVREVAGRKIYQAMIGSSANPGKFCTNPLSEPGELWYSSAGI